MAKKPTLKAVGEAVSSASAVASHIHSAVCLFQAFIGKGEVPDSAPPEIKYAAGLFGRGDEIAMLREIEEFSPAEQEVLLGLFNYHFGNSGKGAILGLLTFVQFNRWRTLVTSLNRPPQKVGTKKSVISSPNSGGGADTTETQEDMFCGGEKNTKAFLKRLVEIVIFEEAAVGSREDGYKAAIAYMRSLGMPLMPEQKTIDFINGFLPQVVNSGESLTRWIDQMDKNGRRVDKKRNRFIKFLDRLID